MSRKSSYLAGAAVAALLAAGLVGAHAQDKKYNIVTVVKISGIQWFNRMEEGVKKFAADTGHNAYQVGPAKADAQLQVQLLEDAIAQKVDAITVVPFSPEALEPVLKKAMDAGIKVVSHEASTIQNVDWDIEAFKNAAYGEHFMKKLGECMHNQVHTLVFLQPPEVQNRWPLEPAGGSVRAVMFCVDPVLADPNLIRAKAPRHQVSGRAARDRDNWRFAINA